MGSVAELSRLLDVFVAAARAPKAAEAAEEALHVALAHGMFRTSQHSLDPAHRAAALRSTAECILRTLRQSELSKDPKQVVKLMFAAGNYTQKHVRDAALGPETKGGALLRSTMRSTSKVYARVEQPFCNEPELRAKLVQAVQWHQDLLKAMCGVAARQPHLGPLVRCHARGAFSVHRQRHICRTTPNVQSKQRP